MEEGRISGNMRLFSIMRIPTKFLLFGETITVEFDHDLVGKNGNFGEADFKSARIILQTPIKGIVCESKVEETFYHELTHMILDKLAYNDLNDDEKVVTAIGGLIHQFINSPRQLFSMRKLLFLHQHDHILDLGDAYWICLTIG